MSYKSSHTFHELEKWHKSLIHRYGYMVMPHMITNVHLIAMNSIFLSNVQKRK